MPLGENARMAGLDVLILGGGAREHALAWRLSRDESVARVSIAPGNVGTAAAGRNLPELNPLDPAGVARYAANQSVDLVVVGPEAPLAAGVADPLELAYDPVFGPTREAARLESSKAFAKEQMRRAGVATADATAFTDGEAAIEFARRARRPLVVKADWLAAGKGVVVPSDEAETIAAIGDVFAEAPRGSRVLLEERLSGREVSVFALVCGQRVVPLGAACDYNRLGGGDEGPNTGGMGAYSPVPWFEQRDVEAAIADVFEPIAWRMSRDATPYRGVLYAGLMITENGPMVLEFNARFGDPEAQVLLPRIDGDLAQALLGVATNDVGLMESVALRAAAAVGVVVASEGYPDSPTIGRRVDGVDPAEPGNDGPLLCFHAATRQARDGYETTGGRAVTFVGLGDDLAAARKAAYEGVSGCLLEGGQHRSDIGLREVAEAEGSRARVSR
jgi:phosphoribosylamine--glycine ligase